MKLSTKPVLIFWASAMSVACTPYNDCTDSTLTFTQSPNIVYGDHHHRHRHKHEHHDYLRYKSPVPYWHYNFYPEARWEYTYGLYSFPYNFDIRGIDCETAEHTLCRGRQNPDGVQGHHGHGQAHHPDEHGHGHHQPGLPGKPPSPNDHGRHPENIPTPTIKPRPTPTPSPTPTPLNTKPGQPLTAPSPTGHPVLTTPFPTHEPPTQKPPHHEGEHPAHHPHGHSVPPDRLEPPFTSTPPVLAHPKEEEIRPHPALHHPVIHEPSIVHPPIPLAAPIEKPHMAEPTTPRHENNHLDREKPLLPPPAPEHHHPILEPALTQEKPPVIEAPPIVHENPVVISHPTHEPPPAPIIPPVHEPAPIIERPSVHEEKMPVEPPPEQVHQPVIEPAPVHEKPAAAEHPHTHEHKK